jgi:hypothetical protein
MKMSGQTHTPARTNKYTIKSKTQRNEVIKVEREITRHKEKRLGEP